LLFILLPAILVSIPLQRAKEVDVAHGQRDWGNIGAEATVAGLSDMGELAVRLGSPVTFNREGNVLLLDTFEYGLGRWNSSAIAPSTVEVSAAWSRYGAYSVKFDVAADAAKYGLVDTYLPYPVKSKYGLEFSLQINGYVDIIYVNMNFADGAQAQNYTIYAYPNAEKIILRDQDAGLVTFTDDWRIRNTGGNFHTFKLVCDIVDQYYQRLIVNDVEYDLTAYRPRVTTNTAASRVFVRLQFYGSNSGAGVAYLDDVIITQNEP